MLSEWERDQLARVIAVLNGKGGVGKTSISAHIGGLAAGAGYRVLLIDFDPQGNLKRDLGYEQSSDNGRGMVNAVMTGADLLVLRDVRENLDVVPAGLALDDLAGVLDARERRERGSASGALAKVLAPIAGEYDLVIIDCPPGQELLQQTALAAARYTVIPTKTDRASLDGLELVAARFLAAREINPELTLLGVVLFGVTPGATRVRSEARRVVDEILDGVAPVFESSIRHAEAAARDIRERGQLAHELERHVGEGGPWYQRLRDPSLDVAQVAKSSATLAADYQALTEEILRRLVALEDAQVLEGEPA